MLIQHEDLIEKIKEKNPKKILLQLPDGLKMRAIEIMEKIQEHGYDVVLSGDSCYGACDLRIDEALKMNCDLIVHIGHKKFFKEIESKIPILYYDWPIDLRIRKKIKNKIKNELKKIRENRIGLLTSVQYFSSLHEIEKILSPKKAVIGGEILGCWFENANKIKEKVDCFLFVGSGEFHPLGLTDFKKKIYFLDLEKNELRDMESEILLIEKRKQAKIANAKDAKTFAIVVSSKPGQFDLKGAEKIKRLLEKRNKKAFLLIIDDIKKEKLVGIKVDYFVNTACPRLVDEIPNMVNAKDIKDMFDVHEN